MTLTEYCTGIADAIREKEGSAEKIPAPDHAARIKAITTGVDTSADTVVADALTEGYTAHDAAGNPVTGTNPYEKTETNTTVNTQADLIAQIQTAMEGKATGGGFPNGTEWTQSNITSGMFRFVHNANGLWVTGGSNGLYYSADGKTWTQCNVTSGDFNTVYNANGIWVAGSYNNGLYYSADGKTWTQSNITSGRFVDVNNANGLWVAGSSIGLYYSTDGKTWTLSNNSRETYCIGYANGLWLASCFDYSDDAAFYSTDGKTWAYSNGIYYVNNFHNANGIWVAATYDPGSYSLDGYNWIPCNGFSDYCHKFYNANGIWVASAVNGLYYSADGKTWTQSNITNEVYTIYNANGLWVAGSWGTGLYYSIDGKTWTQNNVTSGTFNAVYNANGIWVAAGYNGLYYSVSWEQT